MPWSTVQLAYSEREGTVIFARYNRVLVKNGFVKNYKNSCILYILYLFFISVQYKRSWLICFELSYCLFLVLLFFGEDSWPEKRRHLHPWLQKKFEVFLRTQKPLSMLGAVQLEILHIRRYHHRFHHFFHLLYLKFQLQYPRELVSRKG